MSRGFGSLAAFNIAKTLSRETWKVIFNIFKMNYFLERNFCISFIYIHLYITAPDHLRDSKQWRKVSHPRRVLAALNPARMPKLLDVWRDLVNEIVVDNFADELRQRYRFV